MSKAGTLYGVGLGPGDAELVTLRAKEVLQDAGVIAVPASKNGRASNGEGGLARRIVEELLARPGDTADTGGDGKEFLELYLPMTRDSKRLAKARRAAAGLMAERLLKGEDVAFATLGDPLFFSTFSYLVPFVSELVDGLRLQIIPGVTALSGASAALGSPLSVAGESVAVVPASYGLEKVERALDEFDCVVLMKVGAVYDEVLELLEARGLSEDAALIENATWPEESIARGADEIRSKEPGYFSLMIVRKG